jgi:HlyD family secretion protein
MKKTITFLILTSLFSCNKNNDKADGYGNFEATEVTISAEANGKIEYLKLEEGEILEPNNQVGLIDTTQLYFNKQQLVASKSTV